jgi:hypothetical protein
MSLNVNIRPLSRTPTRPRSKQTVMLAHISFVLSNLPKDASALRRAISALESEIAALDKSSGSPEYWLAGFTLLVAIGVAIEIVVLHLDHKKEMGDWHVCELIPAKPTLVKVGWEIASIILVTVGVVGELGTGLWISHLDSELRSKSAELQSDSDQLLALVIKQAGEAKDSAEAAKSAAASAKTSADDAHTVADKALSTSNAAHEAAGKALKTANAATDAAGEARKQVDAVANRAVQIDRDLQQAEYLLSARSLIDVNSFIGSLKKFNGKPVNLMSLVGDAESYFLCESLNFAMTSAEMKPTNNCGKMSPTTPVQTNIGIWGPDVPETTEFGTIIANAVYPGGAGITPRGSTPLTVVVGVKPPFTMPIPKALKTLIKKQTSEQSAKP